MAREDRPQAGLPGWSLALWPAWSGWMEWCYQWQRAWTGAWFAWPGLNGVRPTVPVLWDPGFLMPRVDARVTPVVSEEGDEAARVSMMMRMPRLGCVGPADLVAIEAFIARRPDPAALTETAHPMQAVVPLPSAGSEEARPRLPALVEVSARVGRTKSVVKPSPAKGGTTVAAKKRVKAPEEAASKQAGKSAAAKPARPPKV